MGFRRYVALGDSTTEGLDDPRRTASGFTMSSVDSTAIVQGAFPSARRVSATV